MWCRSTEIRRQGDSVYLDIDDVLIGSDVFSHLAVDISRQIVGIRIGSDDQLGGDFKVERPHGLAAAWHTVAVATESHGITELLWDCGALFALPSRA